MARSRTASGGIRGEQGKAEGITVVYGDATRPGVMHAADPQMAALLVVAVPDAFQARRVIEVARAVNPAIDTVVRTHSDAEAVYLTETAGVGLAVMGERDARAAADTLFEQFVGGCAREGARNCG